MGRVGDSIGNRSRAWACCISAALVVGSLAATSNAAAGNTYVLDRNRSGLETGTTPGIVVVSPGGQQTRLPWLPGPGVEPALREPVGIDLDEANGLLYVTDAGGADGYRGTIAWPPAAGDEPCTEGCGALLAVNPATGAATLVAGPGVPGTVNLLQNPYGVLVQRDGVHALVADQGTARIIQVDLRNGEQRVFNQIPPGGEYPGGLRAPWGLAEDASGNVLVANAGIDAQTTPECVGKQPPCELVPADFTPGFPVPPVCFGNNGFVSVFSPQGALERLYCDPNFRHPRHVLVNGDGTIFLVDPITEYAVSKSEGAQPQVGFGGVFAIDPQTGVAQLLSAGGAMATPSDIDFDAAGTGLAVADESLFTGLPQPCPGGCGGVVGIDADGGGQQILSERGPLGETYVDPIALAVDHEGRPVPFLTVRTVPDFFAAIDRPEGTPTTTPTSVTALPFFPVSPQSRITILCVKGGCVRHAHGRRKPRVLRRLTVNRNQGEREANREIVYFKGGVLVTLVPRHHGHHGGHAARTAAAPPFNVYEAIVSKPGLRGRFQDFGVRPVPGGNARVVLLPGRSGCLRPGATSVRQKGRGRTVVACPTG